MNAKRYLANFIFSTQVGDDAWRVVSAHLEIGQSTTVAEIIAWTKTKSVTSDIRLEIAELEGQKS